MDDAEINVQSRFIDYKVKIIIFKRLISFVSFKNYIVIFFYVLIINISYFKRRRRRTKKSWLLTNIFPKINQIISR